MSKRQKLYLHDILEHIRRIEAAAAVGKETFFTSTLHQDAIIRNFEVIGEIVKRLDAKLTAQHPNIVWADYADSKAASCYAGAGGRFEVKVPPGEIEIGAYLTTDVNLEGSDTLTLKDGEKREIVLKLAPRR